MGLTYDQLNYSSTHVRLLRILPAPELKLKPWHCCIDIRCELFTTALESAPDFEALSYEWGSQSVEDKVPITVNNQTFNRGQNVAYALAALRTDEPRIVWIDALCINQGNTEEKNHQVKLMGDIYRRATRVLVWLGRSRLESGPIVTDALELIKVLGREAPTSNLPPPPPIQKTDGQAELGGWVKAIIHEHALQEKASSSDSAAKNHLRVPYYVHNDQVYLDVLPVRAKYTSPGQERRHWVKRLWTLWEDYSARCRHRQYLRLWFLAGFKDLMTPGHDDFIREKVKDLPDLLDVQAQQRQELLALEGQTGRSNLQLDAHRAQALLALRDKQIQTVAKLWHVQKAQILALNAFEIQDQFSKEDIELEEWLRISPHTNPNLETISHGDAIKQVANGMRTLQSVVYARTKALSNPPHHLDEEQMLELKKQHLAQLKSEEERQRRELSTTQQKIYSWQLLEDNQDEKLRQLEEIEDRELQEYISSWDDAHKQAFQLGDAGRRRIEAAHFYKIEVYVKNRLQHLKGLISHGLRCGEAAQPGLEQTPLLSEEGAQILRAANAERRTIRLLRLKLRRTTLKIALLELLSKQYQKWQIGLYDHARNLPTVTEDRRSTATEWKNLQLRLARHWDEWRRAEAKEWISTLVCHTSMNEANEGLATQLLALESVCRLSYWRRLWIVQEVLLAKQAILYFGDEKQTTFYWEMLTMARENMEKIPGSWQIDPAIASRLEFIRTSLPFQLDALRARRKDWSLLQLLKITENSLCRDPRDKIYGLLGIANDVQRQSIEINYSETKTLGEVYHDMIQWHQGLYSSQEACASLVQFSQAVQASFKGHSCPSDPNKPPSPAVKPPSALVQQGFRCKGSLHGSITVIEPLLEDRVLLMTQGYDRICVMLHYLETTSNYQSRVALERELLRLDSAMADFDVQGTLLACSCEDTCGLSAPKPVIHDQALAINNKQRKRNEPHFFIVGQEAFGVASSAIRDADVLCQFSDTNMAIILRRINDQYTVISKAIMSSSRTPTLQVMAPSVNMVFDAAALQGLTVPVELSKKHKYREPLCIQESSFGWHEFITYGTTTLVAPRFIPRCAPATAPPPPENKGSGALPSPSANMTIWGVVWLWHMLRQPGQQSLLLPRAAAFIVAKRML